MAAANVFASLAGWRGGGRRCACWRQRTEPAGNAQTRILFGDGSTYDTRQQQARALYWQQTERGYFRYGVDSWWADCTEPFCSGRLQSRVCRRRIVNKTAEKSGDRKSERLGRWVPLIPGPKRGRLSAAPQRFQCEGVTL